MNRRELFQALVKKTGCKTIETIRREIFYKTGVNFEFEQFRDYFAGSNDSEEIEKFCQEFLKSKKTGITPITSKRVIFDTEFEEHEFRAIKKALSILKSKGVTVEVCNS